MTLVEMLFSIAIGLLVLGGLVETLVYGTRSLASVGNYLDLEVASRATLDQMAVDIRHVTSVKTCNPDHFLADAELTPGTTSTIEYEYFDSLQKLVRREVTNGKLTAKSVLTGCPFFKFEYFQGQPVPGTPDLYEDANNNPASCKVVRVNWTASRNILGKAFNTESIQSAQIVIRNY